MPGHYGKKKAGRPKGKKSKANSKKPGPKRVRAVKRIKACRKGYGKNRNYISVSGGKNCKKRCTKGAHRSTTTSRCIKTSERGSRGSYSRGKGVVRGRRGVENKRPIVPQAMQKGRRVRVSKASKAKGSLAKARASGKKRKTPAKARKSVKSIVKSVATTKAVATMVKQGKSKAQMKKELTKRAMARMSKASTPKPRKRKPRVAQKSKSAAKKAPAKRKSKAKKVSVAKKGGLTMTISEKPKRKRKSVAKKSKAKAPAKKRKSRAKKSKCDCPSKGMPKGSCGKEKKQVKKLQKKVKELRASTNKTIRLKGKAAAQMKATKGRKVRVKKLAGRKRKTRERRLVRGVAPEARQIQLDRSKTKHFTHPQVLRILNAKSLMSAYNLMKAQAKFKLTPKAQLLTMLSNVRKGVGHSSKGKRLAIEAPKSKGFFGKTRKYKNTPQNRKLKRVGKSYTI